MFKHGHTLVGMGVAIGLAATQSNIFDQLLIVAGSLMGASAPDWMEISQARRVDGRWVRTSVIPHRTITHWVPPWVLVLMLAWFDDAALAPFVVGFAASGLAHLLGDLPNPSGIRVLNPWKATSLRWWKSGENDGLIGGAAIMLGSLAWWVRG